MGEFESSSASRELLPSSASRDLVVVVEPAETKSAAEPPVTPAHTLSFSRFHFAAAAAALAVVVAVAGALLLEDRQQANALAEQAGSKQGRMRLWLTPSSR